MASARPDHAALISRYHTLLKQIAAVDSDARFPSLPSKLMRKQVLQAQLKAIGIDDYQKASRTGEELGGDSDASQWVLEHLEANAAELARDPNANPSQVRLLDVGAIVHRFPDALNGNPAIPLHVVSIDLNPQDPNGRVEKADFFDYADDCMQRNTQFDVVVLSLVLNFVSSPRARGRMLDLARRICSPRGRLYVTLPIACLDNSRYCNEEFMTSMLSEVGWTTTTVSRTARLVRLVCDARAPMQSGASSHTQRRVCRGGGNRNNFAVLLGNPLSNEKLSLELASTGKEAHHRKERGEARRRREPAAASGRVKKPSSSNQRKRARKRALRGSGGSVVDADSEETRARSSKREETVRKRTGRN